MSSDEIAVKMARLERMLENAQQESAENAKVRDEFLARISHELRTPLNAIMGMTELLSGTSLDKTQTSYLAMIDQSTSQLFRLVNEVLDFSRLQMQTQIHEAVPFTLAEDILPRLHSHQQKAVEKGLHFSIHVDPDISGTLRGFPDWILNVVGSLSDNAIKFTDYGEILVQFLRGRDKDGNPCLCITVTDTGIGVPKESQEIIFNKLVTGPHSQRFGGLGMGLAVVRELVGKMGGEIIVDSDLYLGSTFAVALPLPGIEPKKAAPAETWGPFTILLVEDEPVNRFMTEQLLIKHGHQVHAVENGEQALEALAIERFDLVLMDISMPVMDGLEATRIIRSGERPGINKTIPIIALTAMVMPMDRQRCIAAGMDAFVTKPVESSKLETVMGDVFASRRA
ncbi:response regulator [Desulfonatronum thioautotrophicum]|uniref:response regulator n=1 Tax=Desulfonatronum thioautotrophicum TaxID=617001 RepID=UPI00069C7118|nr:response regulator [Desulfonatronum thioautotrophicum]